MGLGGIGWGWVGLGGVGWGWVGLGGVGWSVQGGGCLLKVGVFWGFTVEKIIPLL